MINIKYRAIKKQKKKDKKTFAKFLNTSSCSILLSFLLPVSISTASIDIAETMIEVKQISFPLLSVRLRHVYLKCVIQMC